jgi:hypothetical protein
LGQGKAQTTAIPSAIARICNAAMVQKVRSYVPDSVQHCTSTGLDCRLRGNDGRPGNSSV